jgi:hypothetical protein
VTAGHALAIADEPQIFIEVKPAEDVLVELMLDDEMLQAHDVDRNTFKMGDMVQRLRATRCV